MAEMSLVGVVILNWNGLPQVLRTLDTVLASDYPSLCVIVVDNGSTDGSVEAIRHRFPSVICRLAGANLGYAAGNNIGLQLAMQFGAGYILVLNDDTEIASDMISVLVAHLQRDQRIGIVSPKIHLLNSAPARLWAVGGIFQSHRVTTLGINELDRGEYKDVNLDFVFGCAMMIRRDVLAQIGLFDDRFHFYYEDIDLCLRAKRKGYAVAWLPAATMGHLNPVNTQSVSRFKMYHYERSRILFYFKYLRGTDRFVFALVQILHVLRLIVRQFTRGQFAAAFWGVMGIVQGMFAGYEGGLK